MAINSPYLFANYFLLFVAWLSLQKYPNELLNWKVFWEFPYQMLLNLFFASFLMPLDTFPMNFFFIPPPTIHSLRNYSSICNSTFNALKSDHALSFCIVPYENLMSFQCNFSLGDFFTKAFFKILLTFSFFLFYQQNTKLEVKISRKRFKKLRCKFKTCCIFFISFRCSKTRKLHNKMQLLLSFSMGKSCFFKNIDNLFLPLECLRKFHSIYSPFDNVVALSHELWRGKEEFTVMGRGITKLSKIFKCFSF